MSKVLQWNLSKMVTVLGSHLSKTASLPGAKSTEALQFTSVEQPPLYKAQLELAKMAVVGSTEFGDFTDYC